VLPGAAARAQTPSMSSPVQDAWTAHEASRRARELSPRPRRGKKSRGFCETSSPSVSCCAIGVHVPKLTSFAETFAEAHRTSTPVQIFTGNPRSLTRQTATSADVEATRALRGLVAFCHASYTVNLATPVEAIQSANASYLQAELALGHALGLRGVVVHVGKSLKCDPLEAKDRMRVALEAALTNCGDCPLLLETPAGQGTELLASAEEFVTFVEEHFAACNSLKVCVDTCHVFASGAAFAPSEYLRLVLARLGRDKLALVHFNDSRCAWGSRRDRHALPGEGHIGASELQRVSELCAQHGIPAIVE